MNNQNPKEESNQNHNDHKSEAHPNFQVLNKTKSSINPSNLLLNINCSPQARSNTKKEMPLGFPPLSPQKKKTPKIYQVCEGDTFESIAKKFNISENWLIRQNIKQMADTNFSLSKGRQLNVTSPSNSLIKPLNCSLVRGESHSNSEESSFDDELGENGLAYIIMHENSFDFVPYEINSIHRPLHVKLTSLDDNVIIFTPKSQREKAQKSKNTMENSTDNISKVSSAANDTLIENLSNENLNGTLNSPKENSESIKIEKLEENSNVNQNVSEHMPIEKIEETSDKNDKLVEQHQVIIEELEETSNQNENISNLSQQNLESVPDLNENTPQNTQASSSNETNEIITQQPKIQDSNDITNITENFTHNLQPNNSSATSNITENMPPPQQSTQSVVENLQDQTSREENTKQSSQSLPNSSNNENTYIDKIDLLLQENENEEDSPIVPKSNQSQTGTSNITDSKDSVLVITYKTNSKDPNSIDSLYFRVQKEEGNSFSIHLQNAIKEAKKRAKNKKKSQIPTPPSSISGSASSPLNFFQSIFSSIKETFSHIGEESTTPTPTNNNNNESKPNVETKQNRSNLYRRSFSEKSISNSFGIPFLENPASKNKEGKGNLNDSIKPRRNSENLGIPSNKQNNRKAISASVLLQIKIIDGPSAIFERQEEIDEIRAKLPYRMRSYDWMLIYRLSRDGSSFTNFFNYTRNSGPIVFIMSTSTNERIGAFIPTGFKYSSKYYGSGEAFVYRFVKDEEKNNNNNNNNDNNDNDNNDNDNNDNDNNDNDNNNNEDKNNYQNQAENKEKDDDIEDTNQSESNKVNEEINEARNQSESNKNDTEKIEDDEDKKKDGSNAATSFSHLEAFKWTPGTNSNFMMSEKDTIIIGIGNDKESYNQDDIDTINSSNGALSGPAIWIGQDLQYASSSPCTSFSSPQLTKKNYFYVDDIEIWKIGFFSNK